MPRRFAELEFRQSRRRPAAPAPIALRRRHARRARRRDANRPDLRALIAAASIGALLARIERALTHTADWPARPVRRRDDVRQWWTHVVTLHRKAGR